MKARERHQLKQNDFAAAAMRVAAAMTANRDRLILLGVAVVVIVGAAGAYAYWRKTAADEAGARLGEALAVAQSAIVPASTLPGATQAAGTYPTPEARSEASLEAFREVVAEFPGTDAARTAEYHAANTLAALGRYDEAEAAYREVIDGGHRLYAPMAQLGLAEAYTLQARYAEAVATLTELSGLRDGELPVDGVLMQLGDVHLKAGQPGDARAAFQRVVDEFPESPYAAQARQRIAELE
jgi:TolA-binding protein